MSARLRIAVLLGVLLGAAPAFAAEVIQSFDSNVEVAKDGELTVTETLRVQAEGREMRHGIYRDFPLTFRDAERHAARGHLQPARRHAATAIRALSHRAQHGIIRIYAGSKDVLIRPGEHTYVFRYRTGRQIRWFDGKPELNWNVTGNFWRFPILAATYRLHLAGGEEPVRWTAYHRSRGRARHRLARRGWCLGTLTVERTRPLRPGEGLTVVAELPPAPSSRRARTRCCGTKSSTTGAGSSAASASSWCSATISPPGARSAAIPRPASSSRCFIRPRAFRRRSPTTSTIGASGARNGAPSPRRRCRWRCAGLLRFDIRAAALTLKIDRQAARRRLRCAAAGRGRDHAPG